MEERTNPAKENYSVALSGLIIGAVSLICAFIPAWRLFAVVLGIVGLIVSIFALSRAKSVHSKKARAVAGICLSIAGIAAAGIILYTMPAVKENMGAEPVPVELQDTAVMEEDHNNALEKLQGITDSTTAQ